MIGVGVSLLAALPIGVGLADRITITGGAGGTLDILLALKREVLPLPFT